ncbi:AAA family ATPase [Campylobacter sp. MIT 21-1685]|uniref:ATP-dependent DNA helicase n=1 Tax=unclassified Campylobacter TaxID=2593542 RepID=UPI00224A97A4|nr:MULTISPECIES: AAA family ATPase [unclassified Campylobacter]MCX2682809.1 AAA family ATPase [Campylobacter sp. MIT 21-1684]MCX2751045.1 AAA family ATPase [Campylobacter sp. MIT 21-1682]MCX2807290.1 AAA family ATPase [Campylobacter sp. MIT 21-1685]
MLDKLEKTLRHNNVFLSGGAGVGKSFLTTKLIRSYKNKGKNVIALGSTALSAFNINGATLHSFFCLGFCTNATELASYDKKQKEKLVKLNAILKKLELIVIDEISMVSAFVFDMIALRLKNSLFSGTILLVGDFYQLPPVIKEKSENLFSSSYYAFSSLFWEELQCVNFELSSPKRTEDMEFYKQLSFLRKGVASQKTVQYFENLVINSEELEQLSDHFILLCGVNKKVNFINNQKLSALKGELFSFEAECKKEKENLNDLSLQSWIKGLNVLEVLHLKIGARIIFCLNNKEQNYYNGEQGVVDSVLENDGEICIQITKSNGVKIVLKPYVFTMQELINNDDTLTNTILATFKQFPIKLAYAITIHKAQGMSIQNLVCDIDNVFENAQLYVALSRALRPQGLKIYCSRGKNFREYFGSILKFDETVSRFYRENLFLNLEYN